MALGHDHASWCLHTMAFTVFAATVPGLKGEKWLNEHVDWHLVHGAF